MGEIKVSFGQVQQAQQDINNTSNRINQQLDDLKRFLQPLVATWEGAAAEQYNVQQKQWDDSAQDLNRVLASVATAVGHINDGYQQSDHKAQQAFGG